jgi:2-polyprenyl-6-methoxyphenol hydroxylase-like FAD-dependent oxidoreductase
MPAHPGPQPSSGRIGDHAVVLGASMAGLLAARVLADAYAQVTIVDRDQLSPTGTHRRGVPQGRHLNALLARGQQALEELFPGLTAELVAHGVPAGDVLGNGRCYLGGHRLRQTHTGLVALCASRPILEGHVRGRVRALPNVQFLDACDILELATTPDGGRVTGTRVRHRAAAAHDADLASAFMRVAGLVAPPRSLLRPGILLRVLRASLASAPGTRAYLQHRRVVPAAPGVADSRD